MSVVVSIAKGADASYPWRQIGASDGADHTGRPGAGYYLSPVAERGKREALGVRECHPGSLLILDEASMMSMRDVAAVVRTAAQRGCKALVTGEHEQLAAVEGGGGMMILARQQGYVRLAEPVRFHQEWEQDATLRLRSGDVSVLRECDRHARLLGGSYEDALEQAVRGWMADHLGGKTDNSTHPL